MAYSGVAAMARNCIAAMAYSDMAASCHTMHMELQLHWVCKSIWAGGYSKRKLSSHKD